MCIFPRGGTRRSAHRQLTPTHLSSDDYVSTLRDSTLYLRFYRSLIFTYSRPDTNRGGAQTSAESSLMTLNKKLNIQSERHPHFMSEDMRGNKKKAPTNTSSSTHRVITKIRYRPKWRRCLVNASHTVTPWEDGVAWVAYLSEGERWPDLYHCVTYLHLGVLCDKTIETNANRHARSNM